MSHASLRKYYNFTFKRFYTTITSSYNIQGKRSQNKKIGTRHWSVPFMNWKHFHSFVNHKRYCLLEHSLIHHISINLINFIIINCDNLLWFSFKLLMFSNFFHHVSEFFLWISKICYCLFWHFSFFFLSFLFSISK